MQSDDPISQPTVETGQILDAYGRPPRPCPPEIRCLLPDADAAFEALPRSVLADDETITAWACRFPLGPGEADELTWGGLERVQHLLAPLPPGVIVAESYPDLKPAVDLNALAAGRAADFALFAAAVKVEEEAVWRVCLGHVGDGVSARIWLGGAIVGHGHFVRLAPGTYSVAVLVVLGRKQHAWQWDGRLLATRLTKVDEADIEALHEWELAQWEADGADARDDEARRLAAVRLDAATVKGAAGFFRVGRDTGGRWWLIDPDGRPFFYRGTCAMNHGGTGGRRLGKPYFEEPRIAQWLDALRQRGFNALGSWTTPEFYNRGVPFTEILEAFYTEPWIHEKFPDVFDPRWEANIDAKCRRVCAPLRDSRDLVGYFIENERGFMSSLGWGQAIDAKHPTYDLSRVQQHKQVVNPAEPVLNPRCVGLLQYLLSLPGDKPGLRRAWQFIDETHGGIEAAGRAWGVALESAEVLRAMGLNGIRLVSAAYLADEQAFLRLWANRYFEVTVGAIRRHDPNHLVLGCRWGGVPCPVTTEVESRWTDVISQNTYQAEMIERLAPTAEAEGLPLLNGECAMATDAVCHVRNPIEPPGGYRNWRRRQALKAMDAFRRFPLHPNVVGYTHYKWANRIPENDHIESMWRTSYGASRRAMQWRGDPAADGRPLHGQVFLWLEGAKVSRDILPAPDPAAEPAVRTTRGGLRLGLIAREGRWDDAVRGNGIHGSADSAGWDGNRTRVALRCRLFPGMFTFSEGEAAYELDLRRNGEQLSGTYEGTYKGQAVSGRVTGYLHRPVPSPRL